MCVCGRYNVGNRRVGRLHVQGGRDAGRVQRHEQVQVPQKRFDQRQNTQDVTEITLQQRRTTRDQR